MDRCWRAYLPDTPEDERARLAALAEGSPGRALLLAEEEGLAPRRPWSTRCWPRCPRCRPLAAHDVADALGRADAAFSTFMDLLRAALAAAVRAGRARPGRRGASPARRAASP